MSNHKGLALKKFWLLIFSLAIYIPLLVVIGLLHNYLLEVNVVFYSSLFDVLIASILMVFFLLIKKNSNLLSPFEVFIIALLFLTLGYGYSISIPTVVDRSLSFYLLEKTHRMGGIKREALEEMVSKEYLKEFNVVDLRLTEQLHSGTIRIENQCIFLTPKGEVLSSISGFIRKNLLPRKRLIGDGYSDKLLSPYSLDEGSLRYQCTP